jgi:hypothetical protein
MEITSSIKSLISMWAPLKIHKLCVTFHRQNAHLLSVNCAFVSVTSLDFGIFRSTHVRYQDMKAILSIPDGELIAGDLPPKKMKLVQAWIVMHEEDLMANWELATSEHNIFKIDPLR